MLCDILKFVSSSQPSHLTKNTQNFLGFQLRISTLTVVLYSRKLLREKTFGNSHKTTTLESFPLYGIFPAPVVECLSASRRHHGLSSRVGSVRYACGPGSPGVRGDDRSKGEGHIRMCVNTVMPVSTSDMCLYVYLVMCKQHWLLGGVVAQWYIRTLAVGQAKRPWPSYWLFPFLCFTIKHVFVPNALM